MNKNIIKIKTKKHSSLQKIFLKLNDKFDFHEKQFLEAWGYYIKYKHYLKEDIKLDFFKNLLNYEQSKNIIEIWYDLMHERVTDKKNESIIKSLMSKKYEYLFADFVISSLKILLEFGITKKEIKDNIINKIARFKTSYELYLAIKKYERSDIDWSRDGILNKIKEENLNVDIFKNENNRLIIEIKDYNASKKLGSLSWCISYSEIYYKKYTDKENRQYFLFDFNLDYKKYNSLIGFTVKPSGIVIESFLKDDTPTPKKIINKFKFDKLSDDYLELQLKDIKGDVNRVNMLCYWGIESLYNKYVERVVCDYSFNHGNFLSESIKSNNIKMIEKVLKDKRLILNDNNTYAFSHALRTRNLEIIKILLDDGRFNYKHNNNYLLKKAFNYGFWNNEIETMIKSSRKNKNEETSKANQKNKS